jgi:hypothetical protein
MRELYDLGNYPGFRFAHPGYKRAAVRRGSIE